MLPSLKVAFPGRSRSPKDYVEKGFWKGVSLDTILTNSKDQYPNDLAIICGTRRLTYSELDRRVSRLSGGLWKLGLRPADCVVVQLPNCLEALETYLALFRLGAVPILALPGHRETEITGFIRHTEAIAYICADTQDGFDFRELARRLQRTEPSLRHVVIVGEPEEFLPFDSIDHLKTTFEPVQGHEIALLQLSGGSTGVPKLIPRTHDDYLYSVETSAKACGYSKNTVCLIALPLAHNFPMSSPGFLGGLLVGGTVVLCPDPQMDTAFPLMHREQVTDVALVPPLAHAWLLAVRARQEVFPTLETIQVGGAKLSPVLAEEIRDGFGCHLQQVFGMAEGLVCNTSRLGSEEQCLRTQGVPMSPADEILIVDDEDRPVPDGQVGHLLTRGPYTIRGYFRAPSTNQLSFTADGFYRTGDLVEKRADGHIVVHGRAKELINRGGEKVSPAEVELHLENIPDVSQAAVVGQHDSLLGERICAFVVPKPERTPTRESLLSGLRDSGLATFKLPDRIELVSELPLTRVGKVDKKKLSQASASVSTPPANLREEIAQLLEVDALSLSPSSNLLENGLDSIRVMILVERFRERGVDVSFVEIAERPTLEDLEGMLTQLSVSQHLTGTAPPS